VPTVYFYVIDVLDIAGSFKKFVFDRLLAENIDFCVVINKVDIINQKYLNKHLILDVVRKRME
jgi:GTPase Era involved in 16S rRNA processing